MHVTLIGLGCGDMETITAAAQRALSRAEGIFGSRRLLEDFRPAVRNGCGGATGRNSGPSDPCRLGRELCDTEW